MIPVNEPRLEDRDLEYVSDCIRSGWISSAGAYIERFEAGWADRCDRRHGIAVANGTVALELAVSALDLDEGDEVIMPTFTIVSCALACIRNGVKPVFVDSEPRTWCLDPELVEAKVTDRTRAIMPVHIYGHPVAMDPILELSERRNLAVLEDAAEAHGARYRSSNALDRWWTCGSMGTMSTFSFYANKLITTGEGGMVLTDDDELAERLRSRRNLAFSARRRFVHDELGFNFRFTNVQAALGVAQLERFEDIVAAKRKMGARYTEQLADAEGLRLQAVEEWADPVFWMFGVVLEPTVPFGADELARRLHERGVETRPFFVGMHAQPALRRLGITDDGRYPVADTLAERGLYLPSGLALRDEDISKVVGALKDAMS